MAERDAKVRLNLAAAGMVTQLQQLIRQTQSFSDVVEGIGEDAEKSNKKVGGLFTAMKAGAGAARGAFAELGGHIKSTLTMAATLGGALSIGGAVREAQGLVTSYKDIAFALRVGTGEAVSWQDVQRDVETTANRWKRSNREVAESLSDIYKTSGDLGFSRKALDAAALAATATGASMQTTTALVNELGEKFSVTGDRIEGAMAALISNIPGGKAGLEELGDKLGLLGASARTVGLEGEAGLKKVLGILNMSGASGGNFKKELMSTIGLLEQLGDADQAKAIEKKLGIKITDKTGATKADALERIIAATSGQHEKLSQVFSGPVLRLVSELGRTFDAAAKATEGDEKTKTAAGIDALQAALAKTADGALDDAGVREEGEKRLQDAERKMQDAMNKFVRAFEKPEMIAAMDQLAEAAPKVASALASLVSFATKHPILAGLGGAALFAGGSFAKGALGSAGEQIGDKILSSKAASSIGDAIAKKFTLAASTDGKWAQAGKALGVAAAALIAFQIGKLAIDDAMNEDFAKQHSLQDAASTAESMAKHGTGSPEERAKAAKALREKIAQAEKDGGPGLVTSAFGNAATLFGGEDPEEVYQRDLDNAKKQLAALEAGKPALADRMAATAPSAPPAPPSEEAKKIAQEVTNGEPKKMVISNEQAMASAIARALQSTTLNVRTQGGGGTGSNGLPGTPGSTPGSTPKS
jgi:hypothetical protein